MDQLIYVDLFIKTNLLLQKECKISVDKSNFRKNRVRLKSGNVNNKILNFLILTFDADKSTK